MISIFGVWRSTRVVSINFDIFRTFIITQHYPPSRLAFALLQQSPLSPQLNVFNGGDVGFRWGGCVHVRGGCVGLGAGRVVCCLFKWGEGGWVQVGGGGGGRYVDSGWGGGGVYGFRWGGYMGSGGGMCVQVGWGLFEAGCVGGGIGQVEGGGMWVQVGGGGVCGFKWGMWVQVGWGLFRGGLFRWGGVHVGGVGLDGGGRLFHVCSGRGGGFRWWLVYGFR